MSFQQCINYAKQQADNSYKSANNSASSAVDSKNSAKSSSDSAVVASEAAITAIEAANGGDFSNSILKGAVGEIYSPLLDLPLKNNLIPSKSANPDTDVTFTRSTTATYIDRYGVLKTAQIDEPRFEKEGLLIEGVSTNYILYSDDFSSGWTYENVTLGTDGTKAPDGVTDAVLFTANSVDGIHRIRPTNATTQSVGNETISVFIKEGTHPYIALYGYTTDFTSYAIFDFTTGTITKEAGLTNTEVIALENGWYRIEVRQTTTSDNGAFRLGFNLTNDTLDNSWQTTGTETVYAFGAQIENLPFASSYIHNTDISTTRDADLVTIDYSGNIPPLDNVTISMKYTNYLYEENNRLFSVNYYGSADFRPYISNSGRIGHYGLNDDGSSMSLPNSDLVFDINKPISFIHTITMTNTNFINYIDGIKDVSGASNLDVSWSSGVRLALGSRQGISSTDNMFGHISRVLVYDKALTATAVALLG